MSHGAAHQRVANALRKALVEIRPETVVEVVDALAHCARWFRLYYNSYEIPLKYWPALWGWIEGKQHGHTSTGPAWLYRRGAQGLFRFIEQFRPDVVIATEVGTCEWAALYKRERGGRFYLVGATAGVDMDRPWAQPEVDLYPVMPGDLAAELAAAGVPATKVLPSGVPIDPIFGSLPDRAAVRARLQLDASLPTLLILFGGGGHGRPRQIVEQLKMLRRDFQAVFIAGWNARLEQAVRSLCQSDPRCRTLGWVDNMHEWLAAADLLLSKPGGMTVTEAINSNVPLLALDPLPGAERRACNLIEKWGVGYWVRNTSDLSVRIAHLLANPGEIERLRRNALALARPRAAYEAAEAVFKLLQYQP